MKAQRTDPYQNFNVRVKWDGRYVAGVSKVSGLKSGREVIDHREGADTSAARKWAGRTTYEAIILERGVTYDVEFKTWANKVLLFGTATGGDESLRDFRQNIVLELYNEAGRLAIAYTLFRCWVSEFHGGPAPEANADATAIDQLKLESEGWECWLPADAT